MNCLIEFVGSARHTLGTARPSSLPAGQIVPDPSNRKQLFMGANPAAAALAAFCFPLAGEEEGLDGGEFLTERQRRKMVKHDGMQRQGGD